MKFTIGNWRKTQKTLVHFSFNQLFGEVKISVNDKVVKRSLPIIFRTALRRARTGTR
jgi:hypothetical protein